VLYKFVTYPHERAAARAIVEEHGRSALDYFKFWPDKSFLFSSSRRSFIAYGVGSGFALALADPVGPEDEIEGLLEEFSEFCRGNDWGCGFHQTLPDFLPLYEKLGYRKLKVGDDAIVNLAAFSLDGRERKTLRHTINKLEENGITYHWHDPPIDDGVISQAAAVSDEWLRIPGRRERRFTLGMFDPGYLRSTPIAAARDGGGTMLAFVNQIPSYRKGEATVDLMRHRTNVPAGIMDYLFVKLFLQLKGRGFERFNLGMSPMSGFQEYEKPSAEEKAIHYLFQHLNFLFSYRGLKHYKAKYAGTWEPRYAIYRNPLDLARLAVALRYVTEMKAVGTNDLDSFAREGIDLEAGAPPDHSG
jgi:phosphatidylglycerol lysyltransferase